ncbi:MAG: response regulator transcription factor [Lachnospiraceae bacterium]
MQKILIIEDDQSIAAIERDYLLINDFEADIAANGMEGLELAKKKNYDLIILDLMLPEVSGFQVCRILRDAMDIPIILVTALQEDIDKVRGFGLGADAYITKPFSPSVLVAEVKANIAQYKRLKNLDDDGASNLEVGPIRIATDSRRVFVSGKELKLKNKEYELLLFFVTNPDIVFSKETLYERIWGYESMGDSATVAVHINRLRDKIEEDSSQPRYIQTVWGAGYRFRI